MVAKEFILGTSVNDKIQSFGARIEKKDSRKANMLKFGTLTSPDYEIGQEIKYYDRNENYIFGGFIQKIKDENKVMSIEVGNYYIEATQIKVNEVYEGEVLEDMIEDLVTKYTDWNITENISTNISLDEKIVFQDEWLSDALNKILDLVNGASNIDKDKNIKFFINETTSSGKTIARSSDFLKEGWTSDNERKAEKVIVKGAFKDQRTSETLSGTGTEFTTTYSPENPRIDGLQQTTSTIEGDYTADTTTKKIVFENEQTDPVIEYSYKSQVRTEIGEGKTKVLEKKYIESKAEARRLGREYLARFENGALSSKWIKKDSDIESYNVGNSIFVADEISGKTGSYKIDEIKFELPNKMEITVGTAENDLYNQQKETVERIKQLEQLNQNQDFITRDDYLINNLQVTMTAEVTELKGIINDGAILWASENPLDSDGDLISDTGPDEDYALAYDDGAIPQEKIINYLN